MELVSISYLADLLDYHCSIQMTSYLVIPVTFTEVKEVVISIPSNKAPRPDGFHMEFYREASSDI